MPQTTPNQLQALADDLRGLVYKLAKVDENECDLYPLQSRDIARPNVLTMKGPEQTRADACLIVVQTMLSMTPGDSITVDWHDRATHPDGRMATLTVRSREAG